MLREAKNAGFGRRLTLIGFRYQFVVGRETVTRAWGGGRHRALLAEQSKNPVVLVRLDRRTYWAFEGRFWWEDEDLETRDVLALIRQRERRRDRQLQNARASLEAQRPARGREPVPRDVRRAVWERDGGACVECGGAFDLQYDHIIPVSRGGATNAANLQILCGSCNQAKGNNIC